MTSHVPDGEAGGDAGRGLLAGHRGQQAREVQRLRAAGVVERPGPGLSRAVGGQLDAVAVGVGQVDRLVGPVVRRAVDRRAAGGQAQRPPGQLLARGVEQRVVVQAGVAPGGTRRRVLVEDDDILLAGPEPGDRVLAAVRPQAERVLIEGDRAVEVGNGQVDRAQAQGGGERRAGGGGGLGLGRAHGFMIVRPGRSRNGRSSAMHGLLARQRRGLRGARRSQRCTDFARGCGADPAAEAPSGSARPRTRSR